MMNLNPALNLHRLLNLSSQITEPRVNFTRGSDMGTPVKVSLRLFGDNWLDINFRNPKARHIRIPLTRVPALRKVLTEQDYYLSNL